MRKGNTRRMLMQFPLVNPGQTLQCCSHAGRQGATYRSIHTASPVYAKVLVLRYPLVEACCHTE
jgi:hypothetical protein